MCPARGLQVLSLLLGCCEAEEECAHVVSECLGHLALLTPSAVLPTLQVCLTEEARRLCRPALPSCTQDSVIC